MASSASRVRWLAGLALLASLVVKADPAPFDLAGPQLEVTVTRGSRTLPLSQVPNFSPGDRLAIKADLPSSQSARYLMVVVFLRGATNPPPPQWFLRCDTWRAPCGKEGVHVIVPPDAQQVLVLLAPETGGDFHTLVGAVRGRPGAFVRTSQDLNQATLDRARLERYLAAVRALDGEDPDRLRVAAPLLARSLAIKVDPKCLDRLPALQAACLMDNQSSLVLDDGHSTSVVEALTSGPAADLAMDASETPQLAYGYYSPYVASVLDIARIFNSFHTAQYQYIPALGSQRGARLALTLNTPPSFHDPKSVLVAALPSVGKAQQPPLHAVNPKDIYCARKTSLVLPVEGAPLVFATDYAHDLTLKLTGADGRVIELPARPDAEQGGLVIDTAGLGGARLGDSIHASLRGWWGFDPYKGPSFQLVNARAQRWALAGKEDALIVGRESTVHLTAASVSCIDGIMLRDPAGKELKAEWKPVKPDEVEVRLPLQSAAPGAVTLLVSQYGTSQPQPVQLHAFAEAAHLDRFDLHAGDAQGLLKGKRLDEVASLSMQGVTFLPGELRSQAGTDLLPMTAQNPQAAAALAQADALKAQVTLKDGRQLEIGAAVDPPRPRATLIAKVFEASDAMSESHIQLNDPDELPQDARLTFSVRSQVPGAFARDEQIEVATADGAYSTTLSLASGAVTLGDAQVAVARLDPALAFGPSAFGPLQFRVIVDGVAGDWQRLATLVRLPELRRLTCPARPELACKLSGSNLFLLDSVANDPAFVHAVQIPDGFPGYTLPVPHPARGHLYVKLRDDPSVVNLAALKARELPPTPEEGASEAQGHREHSTVPRERGSEPAQQSTSAAPAPPTAVPAPYPQAAPAAGKP